MVRDSQFVRPHDDYSLLRPYFSQDDATLCVRRAKAIPIWKKFFYIASRNVIIAGIPMLLAVITLFYFHTSFEDKTLDLWTCMLVTVRMILLFPSEFQPKHAILRQLFALALITEFACTSIFLAFYFDFIMTPKYEEQIHNFDQIINHNFLLSGDNNTKNYLLEENLVKHKRILSKIFIKLCNTWFFYQLPSIS